MKPGEVLEVPKGFWSASQEMRDAFVNQADRMSDRHLEILLDIQKELKALNEKVEELLKELR